MIQTREFTLTRNAYFRHAVGHFLKRCWLLVLSLDLVAVSVWSEARSSSTPAPVTLAVATLCLLYPLLGIAGLFVESRRAANRLFFLARSVEIDQDWFTLSYEGGRISKWRLEDFVGVTVAARSYWLDLSRQSAVFVPFDAFRTEEERMQFEDLLRHRGLLKSVRRR